jgi:RNA polymerase sigma factor (sigma-70 family)
LLERLEVSAWDRVLQDEGEERRELVRAIDAVKKRVQRERKQLAYPMETIADRRDVHERNLAEDWEAVGQAASTVLSPRQQTIVQKSFQGWSVQDLAEKLQLPPERVSDEKYKALTKLRKYFASNDG